MTRPIEIHDGIPCYVIEATDEFCGDCFFLGHSNCNNIPCCTSKGRQSSDVWFQPVEIPADRFDFTSDYHTDCAQEESEVRDAVTNYMLNQIRRGYSFERVSAELFSVLNVNIAQIRFKGSLGEL